MLYRNRLNSLRFVIPILLSLIVMAGCGHKDRLYPFGWTKTDPDYDSVTLRLEYNFLNFEEDSLIERNLEKMKRLADNDPRHPEKMSRYHYWDARFKLRHALVDEAMDEFLVSLAATDSARLPYDVARIRWNMELEEPEGVDGYFYMLRQLEKFKEFDDLSMQAAYNMSLGGLMNNVGNPASALKYFNAADSLMRIARLDGQIAGNIINRATCLEKAGNDKAAAAVLKEALNDSLLLRSPIAVNTAQYNLYLVTDSLPLIQQAWEGLKGDLQEDEMRPVYGACLIKEYARRGMTDSVAALIPIVESGIKGSDEPYFLRDLYFNLAQGYRAIGNTARAADIYAKADSVRWLLLEDEAAQSVARLQQRREIDEAVHKLEIKRKDRTIWLLVALAVVVAVAGGTIILYRRRIEKHKREKIEASLAEEQAKRKTMALEIAVEENRRLSENIRDALDTLEKKGLVSRSATGNLEATLKTMEISQGSQDSFVSTFSDVNPKFLEALDRKYPNLTKTERRLAIYISLELDNKHISRLTGIRPESVKQARWRLRSKLGLPEDVSLEDEMKALGEKG